MEPQGQVQLLSRGYSPAPPILAHGLSFLVCEVGVQSLDHPRFGHIGGHGSAWLCPQPPVPPAIIPAAAPGRTCPLPDIVSPQSVNLALRDLWR